MNKETNKLECPCCNNFKGGHEVQILLEQFSLKTKDLKSYEVRMDFNSVCSILKHGGTQWACDRCLKSGKAIASDPSKMNFTVFPKYLAYFDTIVECNNCKKDFRFLSTEQQYWFETLGFREESYPNKCLTCRKKIKQKKNLNTELSNLIANLDKENPDQLQRVAEIYAEMGITEKSKHYNTLARKKRT